MYDRAALGLYATRMLKMIRALSAHDIRATLRNPVMRDENAAQTMSSFAGALQ
jgi:hypothetical protein